MPKTFTIGTRGSLLALTQADQTRRQLEELTGYQYELKVIKTQGDLNQKVPLWQLEGQNFFTKELDEALKTKAVDLVIHSHKDLGSQRPPELTLAAITKRQFGHDVLLVKKELIQNWSNLKVFKVGTSSPRRMHNLKTYLKDYLPLHSAPVEVQTEPLRGNVNTRIEKLRKGEYHGIVLALAGLERLALGKESRPKLEELLKGLNFMVLPQSTFPAAASQGALAIECLKERNDNNELLSALNKIHDSETSSEIQRERKAFNEYGGGCHLAVGIHVKKIVGGFIHTHQGHSEKEGIVEKQFFERESNLPKLPKGKSIFVGLPIDKVQNKFKSEKDWELKGSKILFDQIIQKKPQTLSENFEAELNKGHFYITSDYCTKALEGISNPCSLWASGSKTMKKLAQNGYWVNGTADSFGENEILSLKKSHTIQLLLGVSDKNTIDHPWWVLTNDQAKSLIGRSIPAYTRIVQDSPEDYEKEIQNAQVFYWTSYFQYEKYKERFPFIRDRIHCCGLGKTLENFKKTNTIVTPFAHMDDFKSWINSSSLK